MNEAIKLLDSGQVQDTLRISRSTLYLWVRQGKLKPKRAGRALLFSEEEILGLLEPKPDRSMQEALANLERGYLQGELISYQREELHERHPR